MPDALSRLPHSNIPQKPIDDSFPGDSLNSSPLAITAVFEDTFSTVFC